ncbi:MAG TPA: FAD-dependent oxidoreductase, partial [Acidimicrobiales bacterium]|nr:FAD-dependent oxidoreductase [Acidimicrobiales bacterium]
MNNQFVIVGAGLAGAAAVSTLREEGFDGTVTLIGSEPHPPYERPPLSKEHLRGEASFQQSLVHPADFYRAHRIDTRFGEPVARVHVASRMIELADGEHLPYDRVLIATGGRNRTPAIPGFELEG